MPRYYFNHEDGRTTLDEMGDELASLAEARKMAILHSAEILKDGASEALWRGERWCLWVTDAPNGGGKTLLTLTVSAADGPP